MRILWSGLAFDGKLSIGAYLDGRNVAIYLDGTRANLVSGNFIIERADAIEFADAILKGTADFSPEGA